MEGEEDMEKEVLLPRQEHCALYNRQDSRFGPSTGIFGVSLKLNRSSRVCRAAHGTVASVTLDRCTSRDPVVFPLDLCSWPFVNWVHSAVVGQDGRCATWTIFCLVEIKKQNMASQTSVGLG